MNGRELGERLAHEWPELTIVYMSGYTGQGVGQGVLPSGCHFLAKPFHRENLARKTSGSTRDGIGELTSRASSFCQGDMR
jgi:FixJ family two-component response regulator